MGKLFIASLLALIIALPSSFSESVPFEETPIVTKKETSVSTGTTMKVGFFDQKDFYEEQTGDSGQIVVDGGFGYDVLETISHQTRWNYEFVDGTWGELLTKLKNGDIDLLLPGVYTSELDADYVYASSYSIFYDASNLFVKQSNKTYYYNDLETIEGISSFGLTNDNALNKAFLDYCTQNSIPLVDKLRYFESPRDLYTSFLLGGVEAIIYGNVFDYDGYQNIATFATMPSYVMCSTKEIAEEVNNALGATISESPSYFVNLFNSYYGKTVPAKAFTRLEADYIASMKGKSLKVIGNSNLFPFDYYTDSDKKFHGVYQDVMDLISEESSLDLEMVYTNSLTDSWNAMKKGEYDIIRGVYIDNKISANYNLAGTSTFMTKDNSLLMKRGSTKNPSGAMNVGLREGFAGTKSFLSQFYPEWTTSFYSSTQSMVDALLGEQVDGIVISSISISYYRLLSKFPKLTLVGDYSVSPPLSLGVSNSADNSEILVSVLTKAINNLSSSEVSNCIAANTTALSRTMTLEDFYAENTTLFYLIVAGLVILLIVIAGFLTFFLTGRKGRKNLKKKNEELQKALAMAKEAERSREMVDDILNTASCGIIQISFPLVTIINKDRKLILLSANKVAGSLMGRDLGDLVGKDVAMTFAANLADSGGKQFFQKCKLLKPASDSISDEISYLKNGNVRIVECLASCVGEYKDSNEKIVQLTFYDITERSALEKDLLAKSERDSLTGLLNKMTTENSERDYFASDFSSPAALFIIDIDKFKNINDTHGHAVGDKVIVGFANHLSSLMPANSIVGRIGGDEFSILLKDAGGQKNVEEFANEILSFGPSFDPSFTCSVGVKIFYRNKLEFKRCYEEVDALLYESKSKGVDHYTLG